MLFSIGLVAQKAYVRLGVGAAVSTASSMVYSWDRVGSNDMVTAKKNGYGTGLPFALGLGYFFSDNFGIELAANYFYGLKSKWTEKSDYSDFTFKTSGQMLSIIPALVTRIQLDNVVPYARIGLMVGVMNSVITEGEGTSSPEGKISSGNIKFKKKESGGIAIGAQGAIGADFMLGSLVSLFAEIQLSGISWCPKKGAYKTYEIDGQNKLDDMTTKQKEWKYLKELDNNKTIPNTDPDEFCQVNNHFNNVGLEIGVKIHLGNK